MVNCNYTAWSDEHPRQTWEGKMLELMPHADVKLIETLICPGNIFENAPGGDSCEDVSRNCVDCWRREYKEE